MSAALLQADPAQALNRVLRGNFQQAVDAWAKVQPGLGTCADGLSAAIRRADVDVMAFEYKRVEAFNRGIGALLNRIAAALEDLEAVAGEPAFAAVQARAAQHVKALGSMRKTLTARLQAVNRLQAKAAKAMAAARRRDGEFDADWERLQDSVAQAFAACERQAARLEQARADARAAVDAQDMRGAEAAEDAALAIARAAPVPDKLKAEFDRIGDAVVIETTSPAFAVQFRKERGALAKQLQRLAEAGPAWRLTARMITATKAQLRRSPR